MSKDKKRLFRPFTPDESPRQEARQDMLAREITRRLEDLLGSEVGQLAAFRVLCAVMASDDEVVFTEVGGGVYPDALRLLHEPDVIGQTPTSVTLFGEDDGSAPPEKVN